MPKYPRHKVSFVRGCVLWVNNADDEVRICCSFWDNRLWNRIWRSDRLRATAVRIGKYLCL